MNKLSMKQPIGSKSRLFNLAKIFNLAKMGALILLLAASPRVLPENDDFPSVDKPSEETETFGELRTELDKEGIQVINSVSLQPIGQPSTYLTQNPIYVPQAIEEVILQAKHGI